MKSVKLLKPWHEIDILLLIFVTIHLMEDHYLWLMTNLLKKQNWINFLNFDHRMKKIYSIQVKNHCSISFETNHWDLIVIVLRQNEDSDPTNHKIWLNQLMKNFVVSKHQWNVFLCHFLQFSLLENNFHRQKQLLLFHWRCDTFASIWFVHSWHCQSVSSAWLVVVEEQFSNNLWFLHVRIRSQPFEPMEFRKEDLLNR